MPPADPLPEPDPKVDDLPAATPRRRRPPPPRIAPEAIADARGGVREGLAWLGREPESRASIFYRLVRLFARFLLFGVFRFRIETSGQEHLPRTGGYFLIAAAHRGDLTIIVTMLGATPHYYPEAERLLDWGFSVDGHVRPVGELVAPLRNMNPAQEAARGGVAVASSPGLMSAPAWVLFPLAGLALLVGGARLRVATGPRRRRRRSPAPSKGHATPQHQDSHTGR